LVVVIPSQDGRSEPAGPVTDWLSMSKKPELLLHFLVDLNSPVYTLPGGGVAKTDAAIKDDSSRLKISFKSRIDARLAVERFRSCAMTGTQGTLSGWLLSRKGE